MKRLAPIFALLLAGCAAPSGKPASGPRPASYSFSLINLNFHAQVGGSRTDPVINVDNTLAEGAVQAKDLPIDYQIKADTKATVTP